mgnify:CR=1 FL=1
MLIIHIFLLSNEVAVVAEATAIVAEPTEEIVITETTPQPTEYEVLRANAIAEQERESQAKLERVLDYTKQTMVAYMSDGGVVLRLIMVTNLGR